jgi:thiamine kinase-like enzyme
MAPALSGGGSSDELRREALLKVPGCEDGRAPIIVAPLQGGTSNAAYRVQTDLGSFVLRLNEPQAEQLGVDRAREAVLHRAAAAAGLAPAVIHADASGRFLITDFVTGPGWSAQDMGDWRCLAELGEVLRQLHALVPPAVGSDAHLTHSDLPARHSSPSAARSAAPSQSTSSDPAYGDRLVQHASPFRLEPLLHQHLARAAEVNPAEASRLMPLVQRAESVLAASNAGGARSATIIHNDLHHSNFIGSSHRLRLVDWEYAAVADPLYDLACLLAYYPQAEPHAARLLEVTGLAVRASVDELTDVAWVYVLLSYLWYRTRGLLAPASSQDREAEQSLLERLRI